MSLNCTATCAALLACATLAVLPLRAEDHAILYNLTRDPFRLKPPIPDRSTPLRLTLVEFQLDGLPRDRFELDAFDLRYPFAGLDPGDALRVQVEHALGTSVELLFRLQPAPSAEGPTAVAELRLLSNRKAADPQAWLVAKRSQQALPFRLVEVPPNILEIHPRDEGEDQVEGQAEEPSLERRDERWLGQVEGQPAVPLAPPGPCGCGGCVIL